MRKARTAGLVLVPFIAASAACTSLGGRLLLNGGQVLDKASLAPKVLVTYRAERTGGLPQGASWLLVEVNGQEAILERAPAEADVLIEAHWRDSDGDHFAAQIVMRGPVFEYVIPSDRSGEGIRYVYDWAGTRIKDLGQWTRDNAKRRLPGVRLVPVPAEPQ